MSAKYLFSSLNELKELLRARKLKVSGKKKDLIERLKFHDIHGQNDEPAPEYHITLPDYNHYKDMHDGMQGTFPNFTENRLADYLHSCGKTQDRKYEALYNGRYIRFVRARVLDQKVYVCSSVWAEMKKSVAYTVDLFMDMSGVVQECQCECAVGQGPSAHCKHVATVLYALTRFTKNGDMLTEMTCTQVLQKFHKTKAHKGSPVKTKNIKDVLEQAGPSLYDPRTGKRSADKIQADTRNVVLNWENKIPKLTYLQTIEPARKRVACLDHDYLDVAEDVKFLRDEKITMITQQEASAIEEATKHQATSKQWAQERTKRITSSNFGAICKATDRKNLSQFVEHLIRPCHLHTPAIQHGKRYESIALNKFEELSGILTSPSGLFVSTENPMLAASPDALIDSDGIVEIKCPYSCREKDISEVTVPYLTKSSTGFELKPGHSYYYQVQGQLYCTGRKFCKFVVYTVKDIAIVTIERNEPFITEMLEKLLVFYEKHFKCALLNHLMFHNEQDFFC